MATFNNNGRRAPNVSQYIANLNTIPTPQELAAQNEFDIANEGLDFLNTEFFDFDASTFDPHADYSQQQRPLVAPEVEGFQFSDYQQFPQTQFEPSPTSISQSPSAVFPQDQFTGEKRSASAAQLQSLGELEDSSRHAAEEDKRRRNTAASARFRVKKKQREAALEKQAKEMTDKVTALENKVQQLEMENKWLKGLITEKSDAKGMDEKFQKFVRDKKNKQAGTSIDERNDGVGTKTVVNI